MKRASWLWLALLVISSFPLLAAPPADSATVAYTLHASLGGWGFTAGSISNPGPLLTAAVGDTVDLTLFGADASSHRWVLDVDGNNQWNGAEPQSGILDTTFSFTIIPAYSPKMYQYICGIHDASMSGPFRIDPAPATPPVVVISMPNGLQDWTGGSTHNVTWTMTDPNEPVANLTAWVNYTSSTGNGTIAGPVFGSTNPHSVPWTVPMVDASDMAVTVTVFDSGGLNLTRIAFVPTVDSTPPTVLSTTPPDVTIDVPLNDDVIITFSEPMDQTPTLGATTLSSVSGPETVTASWAGGVLTLNPTGPLQPQTVYWINITTAAEDDSDPGNVLGSAASFTFTTVAPASDTNPPTAVITPASATVQVGSALTFLGNSSTDGEGPIAGYDWTVYDPLGGPIGTGSTDTLTFTFPSVGTYTVELNVTDGAANWNTTQATVIAQNAPLLTVSGVTATPLDVPFGSSVNLSAAVSGGTVSGVWIGGLFISNATASFDPVSGRYYRVFTPTLPITTWSFTVAAVNPTGQWATATGGFQVAITGPALWASAGGGWGYSSINMTNPGPTLTMNAGDDLRVTLIGVDTVAHYFYVDTDGSGTHNGNEPRSADFEGPLSPFGTVNITDLPPGTYTYYCGYHPTTMSGELRVLGDTTAPQPFPWIIVILFVVFLVGIPLLVFLVRRKRSGAAAPPDEPSGP